MRKLDKSIAISLDSESNRHYRRLCKLMDRPQGLEPAKFVRIVHQVAEALNKESAPNTICKMGCNHCCKIPVDLSIVEAQWIAKQTGAGLGYNPVSEDDKLNTYCPFQDTENKVCKIYEHRPIACKLFAALDDVKYCIAGDVEHEILAVTSLPQIKALYMQMVTQSRNNKGVPAEADIREFFGKGEPV